MTTITLVVEGTSDEAVARRICTMLGIDIGDVHIRGGKGKIDTRLHSYNQAARHIPWFVLRDLDRDADCAATLIRTLLPEKNRELILRIPIRSIESWLLADQERIASFLKVSPAKIPPDPELLDNPKQSIVNIARHSGRRAIREDMVPDPSLSSKVGPGYTSRIIEFATHHWNPAVAAHSSDSLRRCIRALKEIR